MTFLRNEMNFVHYRWDAEAETADLLFNGEPARRVFDPYNGYQVLYLINYCGSLLEKFNLANARKLENSIAYHLPVTLKSERSVFHWLIQTADQFD